MRRWTVEGFATMGAWLLAGCTLLTHAGDFDATQPTTARCAACPDGHLRRPPCPAGNGGRDDLPAPRFYAARRFDFGERSAHWGSEDLPGVDLDCSPRLPDGPTACQPRNKTTRWRPAAHGVDNALGAEVLRTMYETSGLELSEAVTHATMRGEGGLVLSVQGWNGAPDDDDVEVRMFRARGPAGLDGAWTENARWIVDGSAAGDLARTTAAGRAYVRAGLLVWDVEASSVSLVLRNGNATSTLKLGGFSFIGAIDERGIGGSEDAAAAHLGGVWTGGFPELFALVQVAAACDFALSCSLAQQLYSPLLQAQDQPDRAASTERTCGGLSVGVDVVLQRIGGIVEADDASEPELECPRGAMCSAIPE